MNVIKTVINFILNIFFPPKCVFCGEMIEPYSKNSHIDGHEVYCKQCAEEIHFCKDFNCCVKCGKPSATFNPNGLCIYCERKDGGLRKYSGISVLFYENCVKSSVLRYKLGGKKHYAKGYAYLMCAEIHREFNSVEFDIVTSAPPTANKHKIKTGFEHGEVLARRIAKNLKLKYIPCLKKLPSAKHQRGLSYSERIANLSGKIKLIDNKRINNKTVLLVDDVCTTGSTLRECARVLLRNGAASVYSVTLATVVKERLNSSGQLLDSSLYNIIPSQNESFSIID